MPTSAAAAAAAEQEKKEHSVRHRPAIPCLQLPALCPRRKPRKTTDCWLRHPRARQKLQDGECSNYRGVTDNQLLELAQKLSWAALATHTNEHSPACKWGVIPKERRHGTARQSDGDFPDSGPPKDALRAHLELLTHEKPWRMATATGGIATVLAPLVFPLLCDE
ncbi:uncharacterized protein THITE_2093299 [Thermothielavioides terrestris NRRL 8126]|uniref:Uncharacterized protein n=1 Tax=Thermothielavioides terrestris (strain ATCC 38088 / NRRL 8126) TaxID=578455 RepID=G2RG61_THETT|nr:uncharacterized protein THITE_2093299 [Thermothielavioides terrestris NRRL 8126]AEO71804.1 hypothetical protein THITE_2093299 [Thermothielavioides terrestris NRRL 8126]